MHFTLFDEKFRLVPKMDGSPKPNNHGSVFVSKSILRDFSTSKHAERTRKTRRSTPAINQMQQAWGAVPTSVFTFALDASPLCLS
jgi:hypothetical protein